MKKCLLFALTIISLSIGSCSKKGAAAPAMHTIKITASGSDQFNISVSTLKTTDIAPSVLDTKTVAVGGAYSYSGSLNATDQLSLVIESNVSNTVNYTIYDNDKAVVQVTGKEISTHSALSAGYEVPQ